MGAGRRPSVLAPLKEGCRTRRRHLGLALGNLKCYWSSIVISYEDRIGELRRGRKIILLIALVLFIVPLAGFFLVHGMEFSFSIWGIIAGLPVSLVLSGAMLGYAAYIYRRELDRGRPREVYSAWRRVGERRALGSVKAFMDGYGRPYKLKKNRAVMKRGFKSPEDVYEFNNGVQVRAVYSFSMGQPKGWLMIRYPIDEFEFALMLQIAIDEFMNRSGVLKKRGAF